MSLVTSSSVLRPGAVVGTIHSPASLEDAKGLPVDAVDLLEVRVDAFSEAGDEAVERLRGEVTGLRFPVVLTVRDPEEGGMDPGLDWEKRAALYAKFMGVATLVDVELRNLAFLNESFPKETRVLSFHDFQKTPALSALQERAAAAVAAGAAVFKVATMANAESDLQTLIAFLEWTAQEPQVSGIRYAVMGMGAYGKASRLELARRGSVLNYGYLHEVQVPGQWPAVELKREIARLS